MTLKKFIEAIEDLFVSDVIINNNTVITPNIEAYFNTLKLKHNEHYQTIYHRFQKWILDCIASAIDNKPNDTTLILAGPQGIYKTSWLQNLIPSVVRYEHSYQGCFSDENKYNLLVNKCFIIIEDIGYSISPYDIINILQHHDITFRPPYQQEKVTKPRIANLFGDIIDTSPILKELNDKHFLTIEVTEIDTQYIEVDNWKLWLDAITMYRLLNH